MQLVKNEINQCSESEAILPLDTLPMIFRINSIQCLPINNGNTHFNDNYLPDAVRTPMYQRNPFILEATIILETRKRNRRLAENLMTLLEIGDGRNIVPLIGTGMERDNLEVLNSWVASRFAELKELDDSEQLDFLVADLRRTLDAAIERIRML